MSSGKIAAQAAHAAVVGTIISSESDRKHWLSSNARTIIVLQVRDEQHMRNIVQYLGDRKYVVEKVIDEGVNEIDPHSWTALVTPILDSEDADMRDTFKQFELYKDEIKVTLELER